jgi:type II secretory ATPase GspE/PulE/Tfp pilus assembly ATPase PilB-like protein/ActR/RegA family two-component response regulator
LSARPLRDAWLLPTLESLIGDDAIAQLKGAVQDSYWETAIRRQLVRDDALLAALASRFRMKVADLSRVAQQARELVPEHLARKYRVLPLAISDSVLDVATSDPHDLDCERTLAFATGRTVRMSLGSPDRIAARIDEVYRPESAVEKILEGVAGNYDVESLADEDAESRMDVSAKAGNERPIVKLVDHILAEAIASRASDIHVEPEESGFAVRYRIDGVLRQVMVIPRGAGWPMVSRIKIMAELDIADRMRPQDGRARIAVNGNRVDLRVSTLPASHGEKVVIRILDTRATLLSLDSLGLSPDEVARVHQLLAVREGIILVTGPTGSGKTTTLYSTLRQIQNEGVNIVTVEDPVEYRIQGIVQVQVNEKAGLTFPSALRSILRQDPDVVLVGEIRDQETAQVAVQASLTGHLVFSTLHTNDAVSSIMRLADIGIEPYKLASALKGVIAQRLLRTLCRSCRAPVTEPVSARLARWVPEGTELYRAVGCPECAQTGYLGRLAIVEVLVSTPEIERRVTAGESADRIARAARQGGMRSLWESGVAHVLAGKTSVDELLRVVEMPGEAGDEDAAPARVAPAVPGERAAARNGRGAAEQASRDVTPTGAGTARTLTGALAFELLEDAGQGEEAGVGGPATVLLVEDEAPLRGVLRELLQRQGFEVVEAGDGVEALDAVDRAAPSAVVLDLSLPRLDGFGVLSRLRSRPATAHLPVIVLTAKGDEDSEVRVFELGADDFLTKPFRPRALGARLRALLRRSGAPSDV